jgi:hypothetical protein
LTTAAALREAIKHVDWNWRLFFYRRGVWILKVRRSICRKLNPQLEASGGA